MDALIVSAAPVTVDGTVVAVTGGPWRLGVPLVRVAAIVAVSVDAVLVWDGSRWATTAT